MSPVGRSPSNTPGLDPSPSRRMAIAIGASLVLHAIAVVMLVVAPLQASGAAPMTREFEPPEPEDSEITLGNPDSTTTSFTWIGYDEFQEQYDTKASQVEQAGLARTRPSGPPIPTQLTSQSPSRQQVEDKPLASEPVERTAEALPPSPSPTTEPLDRVARALDLESVIPELADLQTAPDAEAPSEAETESEQEAEPSEEDPAPAQEPSPSAPASGTPQTKDEGAPSERESPLAARITAKKAQLGKPLAGNGLKIKTVRPRFTDVTVLMSSPRDPIVRIHFFGDGTVDTAEFLRTTGDKDVDRPILDAIYQWRANGPQLLELGNGTERQTISVEITILL